ncbi:hypothetical protein ABBQ32_003667 [Trebouxia sp. C0010 RCD-2024]
MMDIWNRLLTTPTGGAWGASPWTIVGSFLACCATLAVIDGTGCFLPRQSLKRADRIEWNVRIVSSIHALVLVVGAYMTWQETRHLSDFTSIFGIAWAPDFFARIFIGYLIYDMAVMVWYYKELQDPTAILHHFIFLMAAVYVVAHSIMAYPFSWLAFTEVSTPFLNIRWHLAVLGWKDGPAYLYNGLALLVSFVVSRVILYGLGLLDLLRLRHLWLQPSIPLGYKGVVALFGLGWALNVYWGRLIINAAVRAFTRADKKKHSAKSQ